ncbi:MAG: TetM/TetW/TetO/TetS family tetracycline resistance ribosomal protection protein [Firmicutes bacterium]|nr:TetM/TetW/TetO/TetS family tetracycline resistance ribosomal protection protein [Bacillota bacterium]
MKQLVVGILAHVDAGKTTLSEAMLYTAGAIRSLGRVDHRDAFLDTDSQERARGITIFSKQAEFRFEDMRVQLLDTPGHVDFSTEMERTLQVLDYAFLVISGKDGVQGHTATLWKLLKKYEIPTFLFINKMDLEGTDKEALMENLKLKLSDGCIDFSDIEAAAEEIAMCDEALLDEFLETGSIDKEKLPEEIRRRKIFPCFFGSALKLTGVEEFLKGVCEYTMAAEYEKEFGARVYKITRDNQGNRLTHVKITGGSLQVRDEFDEEKINQIRIYSGSKFQTKDQVNAGEICAVTGLTKTFAGQGLGCEKAKQDAMLKPVLIYGVVLPPEQDVHQAYLRLRQLEEEDPELHIVWNQQLKEIQIQLMGEVQLEILQTVIKERFGMEVSFTAGRISYKETIKAPVTGAGHFEPLRHYAEVHLLLEPGRPGTGMVFDSSCSQDTLDLNWQRLIMTHLMEREHPGVLTGSPITDMKITIRNGKAHLKHTEGGDFRQATYRAIRQGLRKAETVLLEPWYEYRLEVPTEMIGRAMADIQKMGGSFGTPQTMNDISVLEGKAPVSEMKDYPLEVTSYTKGHGRLICNVCGYEPCHNQEDAVAAVGYDPDRDIENPADSVFCEHGAGFNVKWDEADEHMHVSNGYIQDNGELRPAAAVSRTASRYKGTLAEDKELDRIFERTFRKSEEKKMVPKKRIESKTKVYRPVVREVLPEYLLVDGYNIIFAWDELKELAKVNIDGAREALIEVLNNYQGYKKCNIIAVFDAYKVKGGVRREERHGNVDVVFTKEAETADTYIERTTHEMKGKYQVRVATSDRLEQMIIMGNDAFKVSAKEFKAEIEHANAEISAFLEEYNRRARMNNRNTIRIPEKD